MFCNSCKPKVRACKGFIRAQKTKEHGCGATRKVAEMLKFPRKEKGKKEKETEGGGKEREKNGKKEKEEGERKKERKVKGQNGMVYWERRRMSVKRNEGAWLATRKKNIFLGPGFYFVSCKSKFSAFNRSFSIESKQATSQ